MFNDAAAQWSLQFQRLNIDCLRQMPQLILVWT